MRNIHKRVERVGDLFVPVYKLRQTLPKLMPPPPPVKPRSGYRGNISTAQPPPPAP